VLGHEIGHVTARHTAQQLTKAQLVGAGLVVGSLLSETVAGLAGVASTGLGLLFMKYGRDAEYQADQLGFRYMTRQNYDPKAMSSMFAMLQAQSDLGGGGRLPEWQSTHPHPENRIERIEAQIAQFKPATTQLKTDRNEFVRQLDGMVFGEDPRQGFFDGNTFNHPDLKFRLEFPEGWKYQNQATAVVGVSSQQDAIVQLSFAQGSPQEALRKFLSQQGLTAGRTSTNPVNGNAAATGEFQAQTQQGTVAGLATYISYEGRTYQLLAYTPSQRYQSYTNTFFNTIQSFNRLTDSKALNVQPKRMNVVRLDKDMTIDAFNRTYPSSIPFEYLVVINGVQPGALLKAGSYVKQVK
jgi:predicted Zn-dependent protease